MIGGTSFKLIGLENVASHHLVQASSMAGQAFISGPGEWAKASFASPLHTLRLRCAAVVKNERCMGHLTHEE